MSLYVVYGAVRIPPEFVNFLLDNLPKPNDIVVGAPMPFDSVKMHGTDLELNVAYGRIPVNLEVSREAKEDEVSMMLVLYQGQRDSYIIQGDKKFQVLAGSIIRVSDTDAWEVQVDQNDINPLIYVTAPMTRSEEMPPHAFGDWVIEELMSALDFEPHRPERGVVGGGKPGAKATAAKTSDTGVVAKQTAGKSAG